LSFSGKAVWERKATENHGGKAEPLPKRNIKRVLAEETVSFIYGNLKWKNW
jgi:hypothetical protein